MVGKHLKPLKRLFGWGVVYDHPNAPAGVPDGEFGCFLNSDSIQFEITPCFNRVSTDADPYHLTASAV
jgi:hypothetical protein